MTQYGLLGFCVFAVLYLVDAQWVLEEDRCRTPNRATRTCVLIDLCKPIFDEVSEPLTPNKIAFLRSHQCGFERKKPKVCCPSKPISTIVANKHSDARSQLPDVSKHRNLHLLPKNCGNLESVDKIVNGNRTGLFEYPWMALLSYRTKRGAKFECGGTVINNKYILTAAHCITKRSEPLTLVRVGDHNLETARDCEVFDDGTRVCAPPPQNLSIEQVLPHPQYDMHTNTNDIGLLRVSKMDLSKMNVKPVCLPLGETRTYNFTGRNVIVTGWGKTGLGRPISPVLLQVKMPVVPLDKCRQIYSNVKTINYKQLCAGGTKGRDACAGDSGGPLHVVAALYGDVRLIQQGIVSLGPIACGDQGWPGVYTSVAFYMKWILDTIKP